MFVFKVIERAQFDSLSCRLLWKREALWPLPPSRWLVRRFVSSISCIIQETSTWPGINISIICIFYMFGWLWLRELFVTLQTKFKPLETGLVLAWGTVAQLLENNRHELSNLEMKCPTQTDGRSVTVQLGPTGRWNFSNSTSLKKHFSFFSRYWGVQQHPYYVPITHNFYEGCDIVQVAAPVGMFYERGPRWNQTKYRIPVCIHIFDHISNCHSHRLCIRFFGGSQSNLTILLSDPHSGAAFWMLQRLCSFFTRRDPLVFIRNFLAFLVSQ